MAFPIDDMEQECWLRLQAMRLDAAKALGGAALEEFLRETSSGEPVVVPAKAGTQKQSLDSRLHGNYGRCAPRSAPTGKTHKRRGMNARFNPEVMAFLKKEGLAGKNAYELERIAAERFPGETIPHRGTIHNRIRKWKKEAKTLARSRPRTEKASKPNREIYEFAKGIIKARFSPAAARAAVVMQFGTEREPKPRTWNIWLTRWRRDGLIKAERDGQDAGPTEAAGAEGTDEPGEASATSVAPIQEDDGQDAHPTEIQDLDPGSESGVTENDGYRACLRPNIPQISVDSCMEWQHRWQCCVSNPQVAWEKMKECRECDHEAFAPELNEWKEGQDAARRAAL